METRSLTGGRPLVGEDWIPFLSIFLNGPVIREEFSTRDNLENNAPEGKNISSAVGLKFQDLRGPVA